MFSEDILNVLFLRHSVAIKATRAGARLYFIGHNVKFGSYWGAHMLAGDIAAANIVGFADAINNQTDSGDLSGFSHSVDGTIVTTAGQTLSDVNGFSHEVSAELFRADQSIDHEIDFTQDIEGTLRGQRQRINQTLNLSCLAEVGNNVPKSRSGFHHAVTLAFAAQRVTAQSVSFRQTAFPYVVRKGKIVSGSYAIETTVPTHSVTFAAGGDTCIVRAPEFDNTLETDTFALQRQTPANVTRKYRHANWPINRIIHYAIDASDPVPFQTFERAHRGELITMTDHLGVAWVGIIKLSPVAQRHNLSYILDIEFIGARQ